MVAYTWFGYAQLESGDPDRARGAFEHCLKTIERRGVGLEYEPGVRGFLARAKAMMGDLDAGIAEGELALSLCEQRGVRVFEPGICIELARSLVERGAADDYAAAEALLDRSARIARDVEIPGVIIALSERARLHERAGRTEQRDADRSEALALAREIGAERFVRELEAETATVA